MADYNGKNAAKSVASPIEKISPGEHNSRIKCVQETFSSASIGVELAPGDKLLGPKLPEGALVIDAKIHITESLGTTGIIDVGHEGGFEYNEDSVNEDKNDAIAADPNAFVNQADAGGQKVLKSANIDTVSTMNIKAGKGGLQISGTVTEASDNLVAGLADIKFYIYYTLES